MAIVSTTATAPLQHPNQKQKSSLSTSFAIYTLVHISDSLLQNVLSSTNHADIADFYCGKLAPDYDCIGQDLSDVHNKHAQLALMHDKEAETSAYDPYHFLVLTSTDWTRDGVIAVKMPYRAGDGTESMRMPTETSVGWLSEILNGNSSFGETKDQIKHEISQDGLPIEHGDCFNNSRAMENLNVNQKDPPKQNEPVAVYRLTGKMDMVRVLEVLNGEDFHNKPNKEWKFNNPPWLGLVGNCIGGDEQMDGLVEAHTSFLARTDCSNLKYRRDLFLVAADLESRNDPIIAVKLQQANKIQERLRIEDVMTFVTEHERAA